MYQYIIVDIFSDRTVIVGNHCEEVARYNGLAKPLCREMARKIVSAKPLCREVARNVGLAKPLCREVARNVVNGPRRKSILAGAQQNKSDKAL